MKKKNLLIFNYINNVILVFLFGFLFPYEMFFEKLFKSTQIFNFLKIGKVIDFEPFPFNLVANIQFKYLSEMQFNYYLFFLLPIFLLGLNYFSFSKTKHLKDVDVNDFFFTYFPFFIINFTFYRTFFYYCNFSKPITTVSECEVVDNYFYFSILLIFIFFVFVKQKYRLTQQKTYFPQVILFLFFTFNLYGDGFLNNYPHAYVYYQDILTFETLIVVIFIFTISNLKISETFKRFLIFTIATWYLFNSVLIIISSFILFLIFKRSRSNLMDYFEKITVLFLILTISFSNLTFGGSWDTHDLINEFYSFAKTQNIMHIFPQYNYLIPLIFKNLILQFEDVIFEFGILMSFLNLFSISLTILFFYKILKKQVFALVLFFFGFTFNFYSDNQIYPPLRIELEKGNFYSLGNFFQSFPLRYIFYSLVIYFFFNYLNSGKKQSIMLFLQFLIMISILDNPFLGYCLSISYLSYELIDYSFQSQLKLFLKKFIWFIFFNLIYLYFIFFNNFSRHLFSFINESNFADAWYLNFYFSGFHIFALVFNLLIFIYSIQSKIKNISKKYDLRIDILIFNSIFVLLFFVYFIGRSHPDNLYIVLYSVVVNFMIFYNLIIEGRKLIYLKIILLLLISNSIVQLKFIPNFYFYKEHVVTNFNNFQYLNVEIDGVRDSNIIIPTELSSSILNSIGNKNVIVLSRFGSIISHINSINGHSPLIANRVYSDYQCDKLIEIINNERYDFVLLHIDPYVTKIEYHDCFPKIILPLLSKPDKFRIVENYNSFTLYNKTN